MTIFNVEAKILSDHTVEYNVVGKNAEQETMVVHCAVSEVEADRVADALNKALMVASCK